MNNGLMAVLNVSLSYQKCPSVPALSGQRPGHKKKDSRAGPILNDRWAARRAGPYLALSIFPPVNDYPMTPMPAHGRRSPL